VLPQYTLDDHQWYPPLFPLLMARLPRRVFDVYSHVIAIVIDLLRMLVLLGVVYWRSSHNLSLVVMAGLIYATVPIQTSYNIQLNPRGLAALMLDVLLMLLLWQYTGNPGTWLWAVIVLLGGTILLTHKMTTQVFWFIVAGTALIYGRWQLLALIPASMTAAFVMSRGFYWRILQAHWEIVSFWNRNWRWIGADPLRESPLYGDGSYHRPEKLHPPGFRGFVWQLFVLFGFNPSAWIACLLVYERLALESPLLIYPTYMLVWLLLPSLLALLTTFVPALKCLGAGYLYVYNTSLLASLILAYTFEYTRAPRLSAAFVGLALLLNIGGLVTYYLRFYRDRRARVDVGLAAMLDTLRTEPRGVVMCVPVSWSEVVSYKTGQPVLWGGHGYGFRRMEPVWPRLLIPVRELMSRYRVRYLLTMDGMLPQSFLDQLPPGRVERRQEYRLYCFDPAARATDRGSDAPPAMAERAVPV
jgi:hypothetical protein